eukprot:SAG11_NODE_4046_length_2088_cov_1.206134_2_plen_53_part_00
MLVIPHSKPYDLVLINSRPDPSPCVIDNIVFGISLTVYLTLSAVVLILRPWR